MAGIGPEKGASSQVRKNPSALPARLAG